MLGVSINLHRVCDLRQLRLQGDRLHAVARDVEVDGVPAGVARRRVAGGGIGIGRSNRLTQEVMIPSLAIVSPVPVTTIVASSTQTSIASNCGRAGGPNAAAWAEVYGCHLSISSVLSHREGLCRDECRASPGPNCGQGERPRPLAWRFSRCYGEADDLNTIAEGGCVIRSRFPSNKLWDEPHELEPELPGCSIDRQN